MNELADRGGIANDVEVHVLLDLGLAAAVRRERAKVEELGTGAVNIIKVEERQSVLSVSLKLLDHSLDIGLTGLRAISRVLLLESRLELDARLVSALTLVQGALSLGVSTDPLGFSAGHGSGNDACNSEKSHFKFKQVY